ncbi:MAG: transposase [Candidatus Omnitrophica bacterium]|jgi:putative transposase|nr:transposase [Candidatus Omnitrophota bacterium]
MLITGEVYHTLNRSIVDFKIFNNISDFSRMREVLWYYQFEKLPISFSKFNELATDKAVSFRNEISSGVDSKLIEIIAWCLMPTHVHLVLKQLKDNGISKFMSNILNSYSRYFNIKHNRKGPLWEGRFKKVLVKSDEQLLHLTRYIHLNPVTASLVNNPEDWFASSYKGYVGLDLNENNLCCYHNIIDIKPATYKKFVEDRISYQRELEKIKHLISEEA